MILEQCPHCHVRHVASTTIFNQRRKEPDGGVEWHIHRCLNQKCQGLVLYEITNKGETKIFPFHTYALDAEAMIPPAIIEDFQEAGVCLDAGCFKASLVMSRRALQRCLKAQVARSID